MSKTTTYHMAVNISGMLRNMGRRKIKFMQDDDGKPVSDAEARQYIAECQAKGYKLLPNSKCEGFDPFGGGCPGHVIAEKS
jgi:hypothetical protein